MSTNGFIIFVADGESKSSYSHYDSGPGDLGVKVVAWLGQRTSTPTRARALYEDIKRLKVVSDDVGPPPTDAQREEFARYFDDSVAGGEWYGLLRATQGEPEMIFECGYTVDECCARVSRGRRSWRRKKPGNRHTLRARI